MDYDVIIIGAGAAGLAAAVELEKRKVSYLLLEARDRLGGRVFTEYHRKAAIEYGAEFLHGPAKAARDIAKRAGLKIQKQEKEYYALALGQVWEDSRNWKRVDKILGELKTKPDRNFQRALDEARVSKIMQEKLKNFVKGFHAADPKKLSTAFVVENSTPNENYFLPEGYGKVIDAMAKKLNRKRVLLKTRVTKICWKANVVKIGTSKRTRIFKCKKVLVTVPIGVLADRRQISWSPKPTPLTRALRSLEMGDVSKVTFRMSKRFWKDFAWAEKGFAQTQGEEALVYWSQKPFLVSWMGGHQIQRFAQLSDAQVIQAHHRRFQKSFQVSSVRTFIEESFFHNWQRDPYSRGAYAYLRPHGAKALDQLRKPVLSTLYFAGEVFAEEGGTVHGAIESGREAAKNILHSRR